MTKKELSFNEAIARIEEILKRIETGEMDIDKLAAEVKNASELIKNCRNKLRITEEELSNIFRELS